MMGDALHSAATESKHEPVAEGPAAAPEEKQLVAAVIRKDRKATAEFVGRFADPVHVYVRQRLAPRTDVVDDLVQEVFLTALKGLPALAGRSSLRSWLLGIARISDDPRRCRLSLTSRRSCRSSFRASTS